MKMDRPGNRLWNHHWNLPEILAMHQAVTTSHTLTPPTASQTALGADMSVESKSIGASLNKNSLCIGTGLSVLGCIKFQDRNPGNANSRLALVQKKTFISVSLSWSDWPPDNSGRWMMGRSNFGKFITIPKPPHPSSPCSLFNTVDNTTPTSSGEYIFSIY